jgi:hypothetical protein
MKYYAVMVFNGYEKLVANFLRDASLKAELFYRNTHHLLLCELTKTSQS